MSRIGKMPIPVPKGVTVDIKDNVMSCKGPKGELKVPYSTDINVTVEDGAVIIKPVEDERKYFALWGLTRSLLFNAINGVVNPWSKKLEIRGVGYRVAVSKGNSLDLQLGHTHPIVIDPPATITFEIGQENIDGQNINTVIVSGIDKQLVGDVAAKIRDIRPPEPYKGKGVRYHGAAT